jgi:hypothetical protein
MPHRSLLSIFTVALLMATLAMPNLQAQQEEGGQRREGRGPGGFGGFGGFGRGGFTSSPLTLLRVEAVRKELKVTEDQQELVEILSDEIRESRPEFGNFREMSEAERAEWTAKFEKWNTETTAQAKETLKTILEEGQYKRLEEIHLQTQGVNALVSDDVANALKLTPEQVAKLKETQAANGEATREAFQGGRDGDRDAIREKFETLRKENEAKMLAHLTAEQQTEFTALKGAPFEMPADAFGFGRGGRGGRGGPGGAGGADGDRPQRPERPE